MELSAMALFGALVFFAYQMRLLGPGLRFELISINSSRMTYWVYEGKDRKKKTHYGLVNPYMRTTEMEWTTKIRRAWLDGGSRAAFKAYGGEAA